MNVLQVIFLFLSLFHSTLTINIPIKQDDGFTDYNSGFPGQNKYLNNPPDDWVPLIQQGNLLYSDHSPASLYQAASIGNGYLGTFAESQDIFIAGLYNGRSQDISHKARIPSNVNVALSVQHSTSIDFHLGLDILHGVYMRRQSYTNNNSPSDSMTIEMRWYAHRVYYSLLILEISVNSTYEEVLKLSVTSAPSDDLIFTQVEAQNEWSLYEGTTKISETILSPTSQVGIAETNIPTEISVSPGSVTHYFVTAFRTSFDPSTSGSCTQDALNDYQAAYAIKETLLDSHKTAWEDLWSRGGIEISGDGSFELAQVINASMYALLVSSRSDWLWSIPPAGIPSGNYHGHIFWDAETWMYPVILSLHQDISRSFIDYRTQRIDFAKARASDHGYAGAMFPWESAFTGIETAPMFNPTSLFEVHINGDIALAFMQYWYATRNVTWLESDGYPMLFQLATFFASRCIENDDGSYSIVFIIPPDEFAFGVSDSVYTNVIAKMTLDAAIQTSTVLNRQDDIPVKWYAMRDYLVVLFDSDKQYHPEYKHYDHAPIKQADVVLLGYPLMYQMPRNVRQNDLEIYQNVQVADGPAMSWAMYAVGWIELGDLQNGSKSFHQSYSEFVNGDFKLWCEKAGGSGAANFITGAGGFLQAVINGYAGVRLTEDVQILQPQFPDGVNYVKIRQFDFLGNSFDIEYNATSLSLLNLNQEESAHLLQVKDASGVVYDVTTEGVSLPLGPVTISSKAKK